jgi:hypothetical protein
LGNRPQLLVIIAQILTLHFYALHEFLIKNLLIFENRGAIIKLLQQMYFLFSTSLFSAEPRCCLVNSTGGSLFGHLSIISIQAKTGRLHPAGFLYEIV